METTKDEEESVIDLSPIPSVPSPEPIYVCKCLLPDEESEKVIQSDRKKKIFSTVARTENYLRERRIPELIRFLITKIIAIESTNPYEYTLELLDQCMVFRAGLGLPPVLYEDRHLEAVVKSFDPGAKGWLSAGQVRRAFTTLGFTPPEDIKGERIPTDVVLKKMRTTQERELFSLLSAGNNKDGGNNGSLSNITI